MRLHEIKSRLSGSCVLYNTPGRKKLGTNLNTSLFLSLSVIRSRFSQCEVNEEGSFIFCCSNDLLWFPSIKKSRFKDFGVKEFGIYINILNWSQPITFLKTCEIHPHACREMKWNGTYEMDPLQWRWDGERETKNGSKWDEWILLCI